MDEKQGQYKVRDLKLADAGRRQIEWAESRMPVLMKLRETYSKTKPLAGYKKADEFHRIAQFIGEDHYKTMKWADWQGVYKSPYATSPSPGTGGKQ